MPAPLKDMRDLARTAYFSLPAVKDSRSAENVRDRLRESGICEADLPSKGSVNRWKKAWDKEVVDTVEVMLPETADAPPADEHKLKNIPASVRHILPDRLLMIVQGEGLQAAENAVVKLASAIANNADKISDMLLDTETETVETSGAEGAETKKTVEKAKVARNAVGAVSELARAMQTITASRTMVSMAHRNYNEGDLFGAQAQVTLETGRAERAMEINGRSRPSPTGPSFEEEAMAALRGTIGTTPAPKK